jgi:small subunit ribosomal protein S27Ae
VLSEQIADFTASFASSLDVFGVYSPKKIKHKRKKVKMAILKYYKVDSDGKIKRLRRECPQPQCGAGIFMAWHKDRQSTSTFSTLFITSACSRPDLCLSFSFSACGKCGLTYTFAEGTKPAN